MTIDDALLAALAKVDTPTVCNTLELLVPERRGYGYTVERLVCTRPHLAPIVGFARTATIRAAHPSDVSGAAARKRQDDYYAYIAGGRKPTIVVIQDIDAQRGYGSFWGEVNSHIHRGLGCLGVVTDGAVRDVPDIADGFQLLADRIGPSHAFVHVLDVGRTVNVAGMRVGDGDLVHADQHGAVVIPEDVAAKVPATAALLARRERVIIEASKQPGFGLEQLRKAIGAAAGIH